MPNPEQELLESLSKSLTEQLEKVNKRLAFLRDFGRIGMSSKPPEERSKDD